MKTKVIFCSLLLISLFCPVLRSHNVQVSGYVRNEYEEPVAYASVTLKNSTVSALANEKGFFKIVIPQKEESHLRVFATGYGVYEQKLSPGNDTLINVSLLTDAMNLEAVTVTSTRTPKLLKEVPVLTRVITANEIKNVNAATVQDLLEAEIPGIEFTKKMDGQTSINMQGMGGNYVLFLVDGERLAGETLDNVDYDRLNLQNVEKIEVVKGASSSLYGSNAIGGVINIITKNVREPWTVNVSGQYGSHNEQRYGVSAGWKVKNFSSLTSATYRHQDTYTLYGDDETVAYVYGGRNVNVNEKLTWQPISNLKLIAKGGYYFRDRFSGEKRADRYQGYDAGLQALYTITEKHQLQAAYSFNQYNKYYNYLIKDSISLNYKNIMHTARMQYDYFINKKQTFTAGVEYDHDQLMTYQFVDGGSNKSGTFVAFAQHDWVNLFKGFSLVYGLRMDAHSAFGVHVSPKISVMYLVKEMVTLRASYGHGFRSPSLKELYTDWDHQGMFQLIGDPDLVPEKSNNFSLSAEYTNKWLNASLEGYYNQLTDKIAELWNATQDSVFYTNVSKARIFGTTANAAFKLPLGFGIRLSYSYVNDKQMEGGVNIADSRPHTGVAKFTYDFNRKRYSLNVTLNGRFLSDLDMVTVDYDTDDTEKENPIYTNLHYPAYMMWKIVVNQRFCNAYSLTVGVDNLLNYKPKTYAYNTSLSSGITFLVGLSIDIQQAAKKKNYRK